MVTFLSSYHLANKKLPGKVDFTAMFFAGLAQILHVIHLHFL